MRPDNGGAPDRRATRWLMLACRLVPLGSLYPWRFVWPASCAAGWHHMMHQRSWWTGAADVVGNVALFMPVGPLGWTSLRRTAQAAALRLVLVLALGSA